ncbi:YgcG family protein [Aggregatibacter actinomycetemcomitans]|nr:YgcG family protein [Aggregatibacter actinomycetemcomitans]
MIKRVFCLFSVKSAVVFFCVFMATSVWAVTFPDSPKPFRYVNDYTKTLSEKQRDALEDKLVAYGKETSSQIAVVIVPTTGEYDVSQYAFELGDKWGIGRKDLNNGVLLLIAKEDRKLFIAVGQGLQGVLTDALASQIIRNQIRPYFRNEQYAKGIDNGLDYIISVTKGEYKPQQAEETDFGDYVPFIMIALFILIVVIGEINWRRPYVSPTKNHVLNEALRQTLSNRNRRGGGGGFGGFGGGGFGGGSGGGFGGGGFDGGGAGGSW